MNDIWEKGTFIILYSGLEYNIYNIRQRQYGAWLIWFVSSSGQTLDLNQFNFMLDAKDLMSYILPSTWLYVFVLFLYIILYAIVFGVLLTHFIPWKLFYHSIFFRHAGLSSDITFLIHQAVVFTRKEIGHCF